MSNLSVEPLSPTETQYQLDVNAYCTIAAFTILMWEYLITLDQEIIAFWGTRTWAWFLFALNRYSSLASCVPIMLEFFWTTSSTHKLETFHQWYTIAAQAVVGALLIMRTYALYGKSRVLLLLMLGVAAGVCAIGAWILFSGKGSPNDPNTLVVDIGCAIALDIASRRLGHAWTGMLVFDVLIFGLTAYKALMVSRNERSKGLLFLLIRDGIVMILSNIGNIMSFLPYLRGVGTSFTNLTPMPSISSVMISRLMLNLRKHKPHDDDSWRTADSTTINYDGPFSTVYEPYYPPSAPRVEENPDDVVLEERRGGEP
ncbi:hypothetical protein FB45DRAFT_924545 [Roridomyces roridus]|uniref:DUF6533 domain-containing protein n=1 Tax=Roridomyces roridus TaxID=1738132 RepID=A0AAD7FKZ6_9AGAR|nr:hypothetical protein FB45DRAFT_924545 [Roridomyces roridus]